jgi:hypothetical protein
MVNHQSESPPIKVSASGIISNPWYHLPPQVIAMSGPPTPMRWIVPKTQLDLGNHGIRLYGQDDEIVFVFTDPSLLPRFKVDPIRYFLTCMSFIDWNIIWPFMSDVVESDYAAAGSMTFRVLEDKGEHDVVVTQDQIIEFLNVFNPTLYNAIAYYLIVCQFHRYFLVEYFKAAETIENELGGEAKLISTLKPYGVTSTKYKRFKRLCNDRPVDMSRHAPKKGVPFYAVDIRNLLGELESRELFESATLSCRAVIDAYHLYLKGKK